MHMVKCKIKTYFKFKQNLDSSVHSRSLLLPCILNVH